MTGSQSHSFCAPSPPHRARSSDPACKLARFRAPVRRDTVQPSPSLTSRLRLFWLTTSPSSLVALSPARRRELEGLGLHHGAALSLFSEAQRGPAASGIKSQLPSSKCGKRYVEAGLPLGIISGWTPCVRVLIGQKRALSERSKRERIPWPDRLPTGQPTVNPGQPRSTLVNPGQVLV